MVYSFWLFPQKFEPADGTCLVFIGQDLEAVGGLPKYDKGYCDYFDIPAGITVYTNLSPGNESYGHYYKGLDGLTAKANWGAGNTWANAYLEHKNFQHSALAIGLSFIGHEKKSRKEGTIA